MNFTPNQVHKVLSVVDAGLSHGLGVPEPGGMCVEAAICYALGLPHGDDPGCVAASVRAFIMRLNDSYWSSHAARAVGLRALAVAQLGSYGVVDDVEFARCISTEVIRVIIPIALRVVGLEEAAQRCEREPSRESAQHAAYAAYAAAHTYAAYAVEDAACAGATATNGADSILFRAASLALDVLREMNAPGVALWDAVNERSKMKDQMGTERSND